MIVNYRDLVVVVVVGVAVDINILSQQLESDFIKTGRYLSEEWRQHGICSIVSQKIAQKRFDMHEQWKVRK